MSLCTFASIHLQYFYFRYYTSLPLIQWLLSLNITSIGTVRSDRKGLKVLCSKDNSRSVPSSIFYQLESASRPITATSYVTRTKKGIKNIVILTSHPQIYRTTDDEKKKPAIFKVYDFTKGNVTLTILLIITHRL